MTNIVTVTINNSAVQYSDGYSTNTSPVTLLHVGSCCIYNSTFCHNSGRFYNGGVIRVTNSTVNVHNSVFQYNTANYGNGGVIYARDINGVRPVVHSQLLLTIQLEMVEVCPSIVFPTL